MCISVTVSIDEEFGCKVTVADIKAIRGWGLRSAKQFDFDGN